MNAGVLVVDSKSVMKLIIGNPGIYAGDKQPAKIRALALISIMPGQI